jgi:hypothetical protein
MQTTGAALVAVGQRSLARMWMFAEGSPSAHTLLYLAAVRDDQARIKPAGCEAQHAFQVCGPMISAPVSFGTSAIARSSTLSSSRSFGTAMGWMIRVA